MSQNLVDFTSFSPEQEKEFVPFEQAMRSNGKRAYTIGFGIAGGMFGVAAFVCLVLYTPCSAFCERPPGACKTASQISTWRAGCESSCRALEKSDGLNLDKEIKIGGEDSKETKIVQIPVGGTEYVQTLNACAFSGGGGLTCGSVVKNAITRGLWCEDPK